MVTGITAVRLVPEADNWQFSCALAGGAVVGTAADIRAIVNNRANWVSDNTTPYNPALEAGCTFTISGGGDTTPPVITCAPTPAPITAGTNGMAAIPDLVTGTTATDDVSNPVNITITQSPTAGTMVGVGVFAVVLTATDEAGNSATCTIPVTINEPPSTTLAPGDIAFVGFNLDGTDSFAFIILKDIIAGTNIKFTDCGVSNPNTITCAGSGGGDASATWYASSAMSAGDIVTLPGSFMAGSVLSSIGDQLFAYQGTAASPSFITGVHSNVDPGVTNDADWDGANTSNTTTALPDQLTNGVNAIRLYVAGSPETEVDNWQFDCSAVPGGFPITGTAIELSAIINDIQYWISNDTNEFVPTAKSGCIYNVLPPDLTPPVAVCMNATVQLDGAGNATLAAADVDGGSSDNSGSFTLSVSPSTFTCADLGANTVTLTVTDPSGNSSTCTATVTVEDNIPPTAVCQNITVFLDGAGNASITAADVNGGSTDNCGAVTLAVSSSSFTCADLGPNTVTLTVTDASGNSSTCTAIVTVADIIPPTAVCQNITVFLDGAGNASITAADVDGGSTDNCGALTLSVSSSSFTCADVGPNTVTLTVTDASGNFSTCTATVTVQDNLDPITICQNITVALDASGTAIVFPGDIDNGSSDNCGISGMSSSPAVFTCSDIGPNTVTLTVTDVNGNSSTCTSIVTITDPLSACNQPPVAVCQPVTVNADGNCQGNAVASDFDGGSSDPDGDPLTFTVSPIGPYPVGVTNVTLTVSDGTLSDTCNTTITVVDSTPPIANCAAPFTIQLDAAGNASITVADIENGSTDACGIASTSIDVTDFTCADVGPNTVTLTVTDVNGNSSTCTTIVTVEDNIAPIAVCVGSTPIFIGSYRVSDGPNWATNPPVYSPQEAAALIFGGNASDYAISVDPNTTDPNTITNTGWTDSWGDGFAINAESYSLDVGAPGYNDPGGFGSAVSAWVNDHVDNTKINYVWSASSPTVIQLDVNGQAILDPATIDGGSTDNCGIASISVSPNNFTCADVGPNTVTLTVTDVNGNSSTCTSIVIVEDNVAPTAVCQPFTAQLDGNGTVTITGADVDGGSTDACGVASLSVSPDTFTCAEVGPNTVTLTVTDVNGNSSTCTATVTVEDNVPPVANCAAPFTIQLDANGMASITAADIENGSTDNCGIASTSIDITDFTCADVGPNTVTLTVTDVNGNSSTCTTIVTVEDNIPPVITCPGNITVSNDLGVCGAVVNYTVTVTDNCSSGVPGSQTFTYTGAIENWTVPAGVTSITVEAFGAQGGSTIGGLGAYMKGDISVTPGDQLKILVGQQGQVNYGYGGGGGSFVTTDTNAPLVIAGGGGGAEHNNTFPGYDAVITSDGMGVENANGGTAGSGGELGNPDTSGCGGSGSGGAGLLGNGGVSADGGGFAFINGGAGGTDPSGNCVVAGSGGFGGGGAGGNAGGGGGGYSGGAGGANIGLVPNRGGGGGGSLNTGTNQTNTAGARSGNGEVTITWNMALVPNQTAGLPSGSVFPVGTTTNTFVVTDASGNTDTCTFTVTVNDTEAPEITCPGNITQNNDPGVCGAVITYTAPVGTDNCSGASTAQTAGLASGALYPIGTTTNTFVVTDASGNTATCSFTVTINDNEPPVANCAAPFTIQLDANGDASITVGDIENGSTDNCGIASTTIDITDFTCADVGPNTVTLTVTDVNGNSSTCTTIVTVEDNVPPVANCAAPFTIQLDANGTASITVADIENGSTDACGIASTTIDITDFDCSNVGPNTVTLTVTDVNGNSSTCTTIVTVEDSIPPTIICPADITANTDVGDCFATVIFPMPITWITVVWKL